MLSSLCNSERLSPHCNTPRAYKIERVTVHCYVGQASIESMGSWFASPNSKCSCNYGIGPDGRIIGIVDEDNRSWCSSSYDNDSRSVTIEVASDAYAPYAVTIDAYDALLNLLVDIAMRNGKRRLVWIDDKERALAYKPADDELLMTVHRWFAKKACPGEYLLDKHAAIAAEVNRRLEYKMSEPVYQRLEDIPRAYRATISKLIDKGYLQGTADGLDIPRTMARILTINDRAGLYG